jgi:hypothetical protein
MGNDTYVLTQTVGGYLEELRVSRKVENFLLPVDDLLNVARPCRSSAR